MARGARLRLIGLAVAAVYALLALGSGLDRASDKRPELADRVPQALRVNAARALAAKAILADDAPTAMAESVRAVLRDPIDARSSSLLGQALMISDQGRAARKAFEVSGNLGWREPATQIYWMIAAIEQRDYRLASQRLDAVLRQDPHYPQRNGLLAVLEASEAGRAQLAARIADRPAWAVPYFFDAYELQAPALRARGEVATALAGTAGGNRRDCSLVAPLLAPLAKNVGLAESHDVWQVHCRPARAADLVADGGFETADLARRLTPFDWKFSDDGAVDIALAPAEGFSGRALDVSSTAPGPRQFASQSLLLAPGSHVVRWRAQDEVGKPSTAVRVAVRCPTAGNLAGPATVEDARKSRFASRLTVPPGCTSQELVLEIEPGTSPVTVDDISVVAATRANARP